MLASLHLTQEENISGRQATNQNAIVHSFMDIVESYLEGNLEGNLSATQKIMVDFVKEDMENPIQNSEIILEPTVIASRDLALQYITSIDPQKTLEYLLGNRKEPFLAFAQLSAAYYTQENEIQNTNFSSHFHFARTDRFMNASKLRMRKALKISNEFDADRIIDMYERAYAIN